ncbi:hypothetical protein H310_14408 [Aphanomyces invadans]|uniref:Fibronectin type-III domain-containing protein n=1 Tax=Aphanomyces invadans TaxID=157072 RepID=A0A024TC88_9STRA|nr:hypothetical protein H310_14408 [Aphanomyces invadans]ETV90922.1 hypothetical protein H310_14408 [Aphanomyces invadans]|eukprot:XP_008880487.1 hypothetical protein H310_14408 [Aphanomyces invadans]
MVGLTVLPLTRVPKWPAYFIQAVGLGLFIQGYAAWGWPTYLDILPPKYQIDSGDVPPEAVNATATSANVTWEPLDNVVGYALMLNGVQVARTHRLWATVDNLQPNRTYYIQVSGIGNGGVDGWPGLEGNFSTLPFQT